MTLYKMPRNGKKEKLLYMFCANACTLLLTEKKNNTVCCFVVFFFVCVVICFVFTIVRLTFWCVVFQNSY